MKQHLLFIVTTALLLLGNNSIIMANARAADGASILDEYTAFIPDMPSLPQEEDFLCGDVNEDGIVNVLDIITLVNYVMEGNPDPFSEEAADVNADGIINVLDIISLVNIIMQVPGMPCGCVAPVFYEGQTYSTVHIGDQCWFRENLNTGTMIEGTAEQTNNGTIEKYCFNNDEANCDEYGGLYQWNESIEYMNTEGVQGICPAGWHLPTDAEWKQLEGTVDSEYPVGDPEWDFEGWRGEDAGANLKETGTVHWNSPNAGATNISGFTGLPGGYRYYDGLEFIQQGTNGLFWTSSVNGTTGAWCRILHYYKFDIFRFYGDFNDGYSVRCIKGCWPEPTQSDAGPYQPNVPGTSATLAGNTPAYGTGLWAIVSGTGGTIITPASPTSEFQGVAGNEYTLSWTITTQCGSSADEVGISFSTAAFSCGDDLVYEGQSYPTILIGSQCWMAENLNVGTKINSTQGGFQQQDNGTIEKYCFGNDEGNCDIYGGLYEWPEAMQYVTSESAQGICPEGWHIATDNEWKILEGTVDSQYGVGDPVWDNTVWRGYDAGGNLKETGFIHWNEPNTGATNSSGFTGLPGGYRYYYDGYSYFVSINGYFWSSSQLDETSAWFRSLDYGIASVYRLEAYKDYGFSVRCLRDCLPQPDQADAGADQMNISGTSTNLAGNIPVNGTGIWHIISGTGGSIADSTNPASEFTGLAGNTYSLTWTITTQCGSTNDSVVIIFASGTGQPCPGIPAVEYEGQTYTTVQIGDQCWFRENLNVGTMIAGTIGQSNNGTIEKYCYNNESDNCATYGGLYQWNEAMQYLTGEGTQGICPPGWHVPTDNEWKVLEGTVDSQYPVGDPEWDLTSWRGLDAGGNLKEAGTTHWNSPNTGATNYSGFTGLPGGYRSTDGGQFVYLHSVGNFWSSSQYLSSRAWYRSLYWNNDQSRRYDADNIYGFAIRCLMDQ